MPLLADDVACWLLETARPPAGMDPGWRPGGRPRRRLALTAP